MTAPKKVETPMPKGIHAKIAWVRNNVPTLEKNGVGPKAQGGYKFLSIDDILKAIVPLENKAGIMCYPVSNSTDFHYNPGEMPTDGRAPRESVQAISFFVFRYVDVEDSESFIDVEVTGEGMDSQDKATRKATTQAQKIANILTYNLITGEPDPDASNGAAEHAEPAPPRAVAAATAARAKPNRPARPSAGTNAEFPSKIKLIEYIDAGKITQEDAGQQVQVKAMNDHRTAFEEKDYAAVLEDMKKEGVI